MNMNWRKAVDGSTVVVGPILSGPIKKVKKAIELKMNKTTRPKTAIDNHSPALNISIFHFERYNILILLQENVSVLQSNLPILFLKLLPIF